MYRQLRHYDGDGDTLRVGRVVTPTVSFGACSLRKISGGPIATLMLPAVFPASHFDTESQLKRGAGDGESYLGVRPVVDSLKLPGPRCVKRHVQLRSPLCAGKRCAGGWPADPQCSILNRRDHAVPLQQCHGRVPSRSSRRGEVGGGCLTRLRGSKCMKSNEIAQIASRGVGVPRVVRLVRLARLVHLVHLIHLAHFGCAGGRWWGSQSSFSPARDRNRCGCRGRQTDRVPPVCHCVCVGVGGSWRSGALAFWRPGVVLLCPCTASGRPGPEFPDVRLGGCRWV